MTVTPRAWQDRIGSIACALIVGVVACAMGKPASSQPAWDELVKAAEAEGKLAIAGPPIQPYRLSIMEFQKAFPKIQLEYTGIADADFEAKLKTERQAGLNLWDLRIAGVSTTVFTEQIPAGWFDPIRPLFVRPDVVDDSKWLGGFEAGFLDNAKRYAYAFQAGLGGNIYVDRAALPESKVKTLKDFLEPSLKGKIAMVDPRMRGGTSALTLFMVVEGEQAACDLLAKQEPVLTRTPRQLVEWAMSGRYPISTGMSPSEYMDWKSKGLGKQVEAISLPPSQRNWTPGWGVLLLVNKAPHPAATKLFVNWMLTKEAQADWAKRGFVNSRRLDVASGLKETAVDVETFRTGLTFNSEASAPLGLKAAEIAQRCAK